jgi:hypothetical protein
MNYMLPSAGKNGDRHEISRRTIWWFGGFALRENSSLSPHLPNRPFLPQLGAQNGDGVYFGGAFGWKITSGGGDGQH